MLALEYIYFLAYHRGIKIGDANPERFAKRPLTAGFIFFVFAFVFTIDREGSLLTISQEIGGAKTEGARRSPAAYILGLPVLVIGLCFSAVLFRSSFRMRAIKRFSPPIATDEKRAVWLMGAFFVGCGLWAALAVVSWQWGAILGLAVYLCLHICARTRLMGNG